MVIRIERLWICWIANLGNLKYIGQILTEIFLLRRMGKSYLLKLLNNLMYKMFELSIKYMYGAYTLSKGEVKKLLSFLFINKKYQNGLIESDAVAIIKSPFAMYFKYILWGTISSSC